MLAFPSLFLDVILLAGAWPAADRPPTQALRILDERRPAAVGVAQAGLVARALDPATPEYVAAAIEPPSGHMRSRVYGLNDLGRWPGASRTGTRRRRRSSIARRSSGIRRPVSRSSPPRWRERRVGLNNEGQASGWSYLSMDPTAFQHAVRWETGAVPVTATDLGTLVNANQVSGNNSTAYDLNDDGTVAGYSDLPNLAGDFTPFHANPIHRRRRPAGPRHVRHAVPVLPERLQHRVRREHRRQVVGLAHNSDWVFRPFIYDDAGGCASFRSTRPTPRASGTP